MAITLPLPVRVAAGILGAGIDLLRALPDDIPAIPVTLVGNAMRLSMKVQQEIATLATRGDELIGGVIGAPEQSPAWAKFDDEPIEPVTRITPARGPKPATPKPATPKPATPTSAPAQRPASPRPIKPSAGTPVRSQDSVVTEPTTLSTPEATAMPPVTTTAIQAAIEMPQSVLDSATEASDTPDSAADLLDDALAEDALAAERALIEEALTQEVLAEEALVEELVDEAIADELIEAAVIEEAAEEALVAELIEEAVIEEAAEEALVAELIEEAVIEEVAEEALTGDLDEAAADDEELQPVIFEETDELTAPLPIPEDLREEVEEAAENGPPALPNYDQMTLAQVRGHLRELSAQEVSELLRYEQDGDNRAPFLTLLSNRLVTLDAQNS